MVFHHLQNNLRTCSCSPFLYIYLHWVRGWISSRHSRRSRSRAVWGCPRSRGTSRPSTAPPATPGSTARTSVTHKHSHKKESLVSIKSNDDIFNVLYFRTIWGCEDLFTCPFGSWVSSGRLLCILWCMWSRISISDQESCNNFIWSSTWNTWPSKAGQIHGLHCLDFRFDRWFRTQTKRKHYSLPLCGFHHFERTVVRPLWELARNTWGIICSKVSVYERQDCKIVISWNGQLTSS